MRIVIDTNVFVSAVLLSHSTSRQVVDKVLDTDILLFSEVTLRELAEVLSRQKFDRYVARRDRELVLAQLESVAEFVPIIRLVRECRDPTDDKFLEVALNGRADVIVTSDRDLLVMHPWRGINILPPSEYLQE